MPHPTVYLAGPDVFRRDPDARFALLQAACARRGLVGLRPSDGGVKAAPGIDGAHAAQRIFEANVQIIRGCDAVLANLSPFRGAVEPDSGTVFEIGLAYALGKPVYGYLNRPDIAYAQRVSDAFRTHREPDGTLWDLDHDMMVEGFGEPLNLMLSRSMRLFASPGDALDHLRGCLIVQDRAARPR